MLPTLGVHLIAKDEAEFIGRCLESVKNADEIIVIDTGSQDDTIKIALEHGAKVIALNWKEDFSLPRNEALRQATTDWVLVIDADEELLTSMDDIRKLIRESEAEGYDVTIINQLSHDWEHAVRNRALRLFRNRKEYHFQGKIHEEIEPSIRVLSGKGKIKDSDIEIRHTGYLTENILKKNKLKRNFQILIDALKADPENPYYLYHLGITHCQAGNLGEAEKYMLQAKQLAPAAARFRPTLIRDLVKIMLERNEPEQAGFICLQEIQHYPDYADLHFAYGQCLENQGLWEKAFESYRKATICRSNSYVTEAGMNSYEPLAKMGALALKLDQPEEAARLFYNAAIINPLFPPALKGLASAFHRLNTSDEEIGTLLLKTAEPRNEQQWNLVLEALDGIGADQEIIRLCPPRWLAADNISILYGASLLRLRRFKEAHSFFYHAACADTSPNAEREMLHLLTQWQLQGSLDPYIWTLVKTHEHEDIKQLDGFLFARREIGPEHNTKEQFENTSLIQGLIRQAIAVGLSNLARKLSIFDKAGAFTFAKTLYREGYILDAADLLISSLDAQTLDDEGAYMLAEILYDKGHYAEAARLFENISSHDPSFDAASIGAAISYLQLAADYLDRAQSSLPDAPKLAQEAGQLRSAINLLQRSGWHTSWNDRQRRCINEQNHKRNFTVHDRSERS
ncbi:TPR domain-containing glycosyltransferase [Paenibacillus azoreducens]|uniref:Glycosyltransferase 2-like domain-containing protein n=1 Tax=Paenibacillus azoreducens TaxID=116718 RepID=A0A919Y8Y9_9BACL|nr:TPR domain-containing glycosyltransferase [Paenibacillus azoreducens]GIO46384.1 hypothetical protein J34TS1_11490 [Paenibacillus azoreducens]